VHTLTHTHTHTSYTLHIYTHTHTYTHTSYTHKRNTTLHADMIACPRSAVAHGKEDGETHWKMKRYKGNNSDCPIEKQLQYTHLYHFMCVCVCVCVCVWNANANVVYYPNECAKFPAKSWHNIYITMSFSATINVQLWWMLTSRIVFGIYGHWHFEAI
jgi:hypothetical protein